MTVVKAGKDVDGVVKTPGAGKGTHIAVVLDETGSMGGIREATISGVNEYLQGARDEFPEATITICEFSKDMSGREPSARFYCEHQRVKTVKDMTESDYRPRGNTPLHDAVGDTIRRAEKVKADRYLLVILTDGQENASTDWSLMQVRALIDEKEKSSNWTVVYLGANQNAWLVGQSLGVKPGNIMGWTATSGGTGITMRSAAGATANYFADNQMLAQTGTFFADAGQTEADYADTPPETGPTGKRAGSPSRSVKAGQDSTTGGSHGST